MLNFGKNTIRMLSRLLAISILLGGTLSAWASVDIALMGSDMDAAPTCHQSAANSVHGNIDENCCTSSGDCSGFCAFLSAGNATVFVSDIAIDYLTGHLYHSSIQILPRGISRDLFYRPPILSA